MKGVNDTNEDKSFKSKKEIKGIEDHNEKSKEIIFSTSKSTKLSPNLSFVMSNHNEFLASNSELNYFKSRCDELNQELIRKQSELQILYDTLNNRENTIQNLMNKIGFSNEIKSKHENKTLEVGNLKKTIQELQIINANLNLSLQSKDKRINEFDEVVNLAKRKFSVFESNNEYLRNENEGLRSTIEELQNMKIKKNEEFSLEKSIDNKEEIHQKLKFEYAILKKKQDKLETIVSEKTIEYFKNLNSKEKEVEEMIIKNNNLKNEINEIEFRFKESSKLHFERIKEYQEKEVNMKNTISYNERKISENEKEITKYKEIFQNCSQTIQNQIEEITKKNDIILKLESNYNKSLVELKKIIQESLEKENQLKSEISNRDQELKELKSELDDLTIQKEQEITKNVNNTNKINDLSSLLEVSSKTINDLKTERLQKEINENHIRELSKELREKQEIHGLDIIRLKQQMMRRDDELSQMIMTYVSKLDYITNQMTERKLINEDSLSLLKEIENFKEDLKNQNYISFKNSSSQRQSKILNDILISPKKTLENLSEAIKQIDIRQSGNQN